MANTDNLKRGNAETQFRTGREQVEIARKGGIASGVARREKTGFRKAFQAALESTYTDKKTGKTFNGYDAIVNKIIAVCFDDKHKNWGKAIDMAAKFSDDESISREELQAELLQAKIKAMNNDDVDETESDGFLEALNASASEDWNEGEENEESEIQV